MIISKTPLRISFAGGGTDLADFYRSPMGPGCVVSTAINKYIYITVNRKFDDLLRVSYSKTEIVDSVEKVEHNIIREALKLTGVTSGVDVVYMGDIPLGSAGVGLGSSSALAVGVLNALYAMKGQHVSAERLAREACQIEIDILGYPIGKQDQYAAAFGGMNYLQFNPDESVVVEPVIFRAATKAAIEQRMLLFYTGQMRVSSAILTEQRAGIEQNMDLHRQLATMARNLRASLWENDYDVMGEVLAEGWRLKTRLASNVTNPTIDRWYDAALKAGAAGGKLVGAGGGGFLLFCCDESRQPDVRRALSDLKLCPFSFEPQGSRIIYVGE